MTVSLTPNALYPGSLKVETVTCPHCGEKAEYSAGRRRAFLRCRDCGYERSWDL